MIVAKTKQESDLLCEQEISHVLYAGKARGTIYKNAYIEGDMYYETVRYDNVDTIKTKKYGVIPFFDDISELLTSRHNKGCVAVICSALSHKKIRSGVIDVIHVATHKQPYEFMAKEFGGGHMKMNNIELVQPNQAYFLVVQRENSSDNGVIILDNFKINKHEKQ